MQNKDSFSVIYLVIYVTIYLDTLPGLKVGDVSGLLWEESECEASIYESRSPPGRHTGSF